VWDIGNIGAEPQRARIINFTAAYCEIESTYLVPAGSPIQSIADVDKPGIRISVTGRSAYGLWLENNIKNATLVRTDSLNASFDKFVDEKLDVLAGLRPRLIDDVKKLPGARILDGVFTAVQQAIGTAKKNTAAASFLAAFVEEVKASGFVGEAITRNKSEGVNVAPPAR
jgi:polar amino acid transport system substrate-binding protein